MKLITFTIGYKMKNIVYAALLTVAALPASAEGVYAGFGSGNVTAKEPGFSATSLNAIGLVGYEVNDYISVEGEASFVIRDGSFEGIDIGNTHMGAFVKLAASTSGPFTPHARIGYVNGKVTVSNGNASDSLDDNAFAYGIGAEYAFSNSSLRADYTVADFGVTETNVLSITTVFKF